METRAALPVVSPGATPQRQNLSKKMIVYEICHVAGHLVGSRDEDELLLISETLDMLSHNFGSSAMWEGKIVYPKSQEDVQTKTQLDSTTLHSQPHCKPILEPQSCLTLELFTHKGVIDKTKREISVMNMIKHEHVVHLINNETNRGSLLRNRNFFT
ncbi:CBL-interacting protein kinase 20 [Striga asiatica]|uniref:CBL-interacting protein kinase 20 n=1 Tax=Striga asiatica TaxID=4170 RepID=A0A5A7QXX1_STRAF|nr:CBL-interacting protein kinase 20 [Striga asiatica]